MFALDVGQHQRRGDPVQHVRRGAPPRPCSSHVYQVGLMLARWATSSRRSPGVRRVPPETEGGRIKPGAAILQIGSQQIVGFGSHADPVSDYTMITSLL